MMFAYVSLAARLVPLLLMTSALLAGTKWIHETLSRRNANAANVAAVAFCLAMMVVIVPYAARMSLTAGATWALLHDEWQPAADRLEMLQRFGGHLPESLHYGHGLALLHLGRYDAALPELERAAAAPPGDYVPAVDAQLNAGFAAFRLGDDARAIDHLKRIPAESNAAPERDYLLGRIAERHGRPDDAEKAFRRSLAERHDFHPALYRLLRLCSMRHDANGAHQVVADFVEHNPAEAEAAYLKEIVAAIDRGEVLADYDPYRMAP